MGLRSMETSHKTVVILRCKLILVGDACVGKTALTQSFSSGGTTYPKNYLMTIGAEFNVKQVSIPDTNVVVEIFLYDCAGQSIFNQLDLNTKYYENASAVMVVSSVASRESLLSCSKWVSGVKAAQNSNNNLIGVFVGNKCEFRDGSIDSRAEVDLLEAKEMAESMGMPYFETSAANNINVEAPFQYIAEEFYRRYEDAIQATREG
eukprot:CAMPEP_0170355378 /NCGR_PEP_ID=MMETSP0117_2-20130122/612_1 /TAXON_ID=400756 /ORGANISM="Durinskia baltica, Strain CSIRO CS-38" /LENGTH=205 /DNA_ID=CAMNT_0010609415 /DNA_START=68 /DNA_END=685 /DNA_ORIENTATION=+